jgi:hypothetical protein
MMCMWIGDGVGVHVEGWGLLEGCWDVCIWRGDVVVGVFDDGLLAVCMCALMWPAESVRV